MYLPPDDPAILIVDSPPLRKASTHSFKRSAGSCATDPRIQAKVARLAARMYPNLPFALVASLITVCVVMPHNLMVGVRVHLHLIVQTIQLASFWIATDEHVPQGLLYSAHWWTAS